MRRTKFWVGKLIMMGIFSLICICERVSSAENGQVKKINEEEHRKILKEMEEKSRQKNEEIRKKFQEWQDNLRIKHQRYPKMQARSEFFSEFDLRLIV